MISAASELIESTLRWLDDRLVDPSMMIIGDVGSDSNIVDKPLCLSHGCWTLDDGFWGNWEPSNGMKSS